MEVKITIEVRAEDENDALAIALNAYNAGGFTELVSIDTPNLHKEYGVGAEISRG